MASLFSALTSGAPPTVDPVSLTPTNKPEPEPVINSEMDDLPLPEGADLPTPEQTKLTMALVAKHLENLPAEPSHSDDLQHLEVGPAEKPSAPSLERGSSSRADVGFSDDVEESSGPDTDNEDHLLTQERLDVLSATSEIHTHRDKLSKISARIRELSSKVDAVVDIDTRIRKLEAINAELTKRLDSTSTAYSNLSKSFTMYQTHTASKIADVERRFATKQLSVKAQPDEEALVPPTVVEKTRQSGIMSSPTIDAPAVPAMKRAANLDGF